MRTQRILTIGVCLVLAAAACSGDDAGSAATASPTTATTAATTTTTTTTDPTVTTEDALLAADAYFESYNAGDVEAVLALFEPEATFTDNFGEMSADDWEQLLVWNAAQGTALSDPTCSAVPDNDGGMIVNCPHMNLDALVQAVSGPAVPIDMTLLITPAGISQWTWYFGNPDFNAVGNPFDRWISENHPEDADAAGFGSWNSIEEAERHGLLRARYAAEWGDWLTENDCDYRLGC